MVTPKLGAKWTVDRVDIRYSLFKKKKILYANSAAENDNKSWVSSA